MLRFQRATSSLMTPYVQFSLPISFGHQATLDIHWNEGCYYPPVLQFRTNRNRHLSSFDGFEARVAYFLFVIFVEILLCSRQMVFDGAVDRLLGILVLSNWVGKLKLESFELASILNRNERRTHLFRCSKLSHDVNVASLFTELFNESASFDELIVHQHRFWEQRRDRGVIRQHESGNPERRFEVRRTSREANPYAGGCPRNESRIPAIAQACQRRVKLQKEKHSIVSWGRRSRATERGNCKREVFICEITRGSHSHPMCLRLPEWCSTGSRSSVGCHWSSSKPSCSFAGEASS